MLSEKKKPYISIGGTFSSFSTSDINDDSGSAGATFYQQFTKERLFQSAEITHTLIRQQDNGKPIKPFAVYVIMVSTQDIDYTIERRYSCFHSLYKKLGKKVNFKSEFPAKAFLTPSTNEVLVSKRKSDLNSKQQGDAEFLAEVIGLDNKEYLVDFFDFLEVRQVYAKQKILLSYQKEVDRKMDEDVILDLLTKLGTHLEPIVMVVASLERELFDNKLRVTNQVIRQLFMGLGKRKGLLQISLNQDGHQLQSLKGLQLLTRLLNFQQNRQAEVYIRNFVACPLKHLRIIPTLFNSSQIKLNYFKLLQIYFKRNCDLNYQSSLDTLFGGAVQERKEFDNWVKSRERSTISIDYEEGGEVEAKPKDIQATMGWLRGMIESEKGQWQPVIASGKAGVYHLKMESCQGVLKLTYDSNKSEADLRSLFVDSMKWYKWATFSRVDPYTKTLSVTMQLGQPKKFRFCWGVAEQGPSALLIKQPYGKRSNPEFDSFYQIVRLGRTEGDWSSRVQVWRFFESPDSKEYFQKEVAGLVEPLADALLE